MIFNYIISRIINLYKHSKCNAGKNCYIERSTVVNGAILEGKNIIRIGVNILNSHVGFATYIGENSYIPESYIGKFCSIARNISIVQGNHPSRDWLSTHPSFFSTGGQSGAVYVNDNLFDELLYADSIKKFYVIVENDVWIGSNCLIMAGTRVHNGAIIAAGSVVTKDVPPYAIVAGVPARVVRYRFEPDTIEWLLKFKWWDKDEKWIQENAVSFKSIKDFRKNNSY